MASDDRYGGASGGGGGAAGGGGGGGGGGEAELDGDTVTGAKKKKSKSKRKSKVAAVIASGHDYLKEEEKQSQPLIETDYVDGEEDEFVPHMTLEQASQLQPGDHIDHRDDVGRYLLALVTEKHGYKLKIHYEGWNPKWDVVSDYGVELYRFAAPKSISRR